MVGESMQNPRGRGTLGEKGIDEQLDLTYRDFYRYCRDSKEYIEGRRRFVVR
jgi:hypothetical protein